MAEGSDFVPITQDLVFTAGIEQLCFDVKIVMDEVLENTEVFRLSISSLANDPAITFESTILSVAIENDDSKPAF